MKNLIKLILPLIFVVFSSFAFAEPVNINTADAAALAKNINGVGEKKAVAIIEYRKAHGPFKKVEDLMKVKGISLKTLEKNRDNLTVAKADKKTSTK